MSRRALSICLLALTLSAPAAGAQVVLSGSQGGGVIASHAVPARISGELVVSFHGDDASGCAGHGLCDYRGTVILRPGPQGELTVETIRRGGKLSQQAQLDLGQAGSASEVSRAGRAGRCADIEQPSAAVSLPVRGREVSLGLLQAGGSLLATRCAGPLDSDLLAALPGVEVSTTALSAGHRTIDLGGSGSFATGGLAGTVSSTVRLVLGKPQPGHVRAPHAKKFKRLRIVTEQLDVSRLGVGLNAVIRGASDPNVCSLLDSCGVQGSLRGTAQPHGASAELVAIGPARLRYPRFLAALHGRRVPGVTLSGEVSWSAQGAVSETLRSAGRSCNDTAAMPAGVIALSAARNMLLASYSAAAPARTRCPGPYLAGLAGGRARRAGLARRSLELTLRGSGARVDDGYELALGSSVRLQLRRGAVSQQVLRLPAG